jgi:hypothetical protein
MNAFLFDVVVGTTASSSMLPAASQLKIVLVGVCDQVCLHSSLTWCGIN